MYPMMRIISVSYTHLDVYKRQQFNNKNFALQIKEREIFLDIKTNGWKEVGDYFLSRIKNCNPTKIKFLHAIIWLSLTTYALSLIHI